MAYRPYGASAISPLNDAHVLQREGHILIPLLSGGAHTPTPYLGTFILSFTTGVIQSVLGTQFRCKEKLAFRTPPPHMMDRPITIQTVTDLTRPPAQGQDEVRPLVFLTTRDYGLGKIAIQEPPSPHCC